MKESAKGRFFENNHMCKCGLAKEKEAHITSGQYPIYSDIPEKYTEFDEDEDLVSYFDEVLERRGQIETLEQDEDDFKD